MRFINILTSLLLLIIIFSCNNNINKNGIENQLIVHIELKIVQNDVLELYFDNRETNTFSSKKSIRKKIKGSNSFQKVSFIFPCYTRGHSHTYIIVIFKQLRHNHYGDKLNATRHYLLC